VLRALEAAQEVIAIKKFMYVLIKIGAWWFLIIGSILSIFSFVGIFNPEQSPELDTVLRVGLFILVSTITYLAFLMVKSKKLW
jgi:hypothetical protein